MVAGVLAGLTYLWLYGKAFNLEPGAGFTWQGAALAEIAYSLLEFIEA